MAVEKGLLMSRCLILMILLLCLGSCGGKSEESEASAKAEGGESTTQGRKDLSPEVLDRIDPYRSLFEDLSPDEAFQKADEKGRMVVIYYHAEGCERCRQFEEEVLSSESVQAWLSENAVLIRNRTSDEAQRMFQRYSDGRGLPFPSVILLRSNGDRLRVIRPDIKQKIPQEVLLKNLREVRSLTR